MPNAHPMQAHLSSWLGDKPIFTVYSATQRYHVYDGEYTVARYRDGRSFNMRLMHPRYAGLRAQLDAAIAAIAAIAPAAGAGATVPDADQWHIFFRCAERRGDAQLDVEADSLPLAEGKADAYAACHDLTHFRVLNIAPLAAHQYRQA